MRLLKPFENKGSNEAEKAAAYIHPVEAILLRFYYDLAEVFAKHGTRLLDISILLFIAFLPYHLVNVSATIFGRAVRPTEFLFALVTTFFVYALLRGLVTIRKAYWLYFFLVLHATAQLVSVLFAPHGIDSYGPAISAATYSFVLFILINAIRSDALARLVLQVMGFSVFGVVIHSLYLYIIQGGIFLTREQPTIIGTDIGNYLAYLLVMFGAGSVYLFFRHREVAKKGLAPPWSVTILFFTVVAWMYVVLLSGVKIAHIATFGFLLLLVVVLKGHRIWTFVFSALFVLLFFVQFNTSIIQEQTTSTYFAVREKVRDFEDSVVDRGENIGASLLAFVAPEEKEEATTASSVVAVAIATDTTQTTAPENIVEVNVSVPEVIIEQSLLEAPEEGYGPHYDEVEIEDVEGVPLAVLLEEIASKVVFEEGRSDDVLTTSQEEETSVTSDAITREINVIRVAWASIELVEEPAAPESEAEIIFEEEEGFEDVLVMPSPERVPGYEEYVAFRYASSDKGVELETVAPLLEQDQLRTRWTVGASSSFRLRVRGMLAALYMGAAYPFTGVGAGEQMYFFDHFSEIVREKAYDESYLSFLPNEMRHILFTEEKWTISQTNPNNILLMAWAETGLMGLIAIIGILLVVTLRGIHGLWRARRSRQVLAMRILVPSFAALMLFQFVNPFILHPWLWTTLALVYVTSVEGALPEPQSYVQ